MAKVKINDIANKKKAVDDFFNKETEESKAYWLTKEKHKYIIDKIEYGEKDTKKNYPKIADMINNNKICYLYTINLLEKEIRERSFDIVPTNTQFQEWNDDIKILNSLKNEVFSQAKVLEGLMSDLESMAKQIVSKKFEEISN